MEQLKTFRTKFNANIDSHEKLTVLLSEVVDANEEDKSATNNELEKCASLNMDANEVIATVDERIQILEVGDVKYTVRRTATLQDEKVEHEIEKLKLETEYQRSKIEQMKANGGETRKQKIKLPPVNLPSFSGKIVY